MLYALPGHLCEGTFLDVADANFEAISAPDSASLFIPSALLKCPLMF